MQKKRKPVAVKPGKKNKTGTTPLRHLMKVIAATIILIGFVFAAGLAVIFLIPVHEPVVKTAAPAIKPAAQRLVFEIYPSEKKPPPPPAGPDSSGISPSPPPATDGRPRIAIIIDDLGYDRAIANQLIALDPSLTLSILPGSSFPDEIAAAAHQAGLEVMLHLPMEPVEYPDVDPGPGVLLTGMSPDTLLGQLEKNIADVPYIKGVNNHMGSKLTAESIQLYQIFSVLKKHDLFFIDSRTTEKSICGPSAKKLQVPFAERDVFLDNTLSEADITRQLNRLVDIAVHRGKAIGIGHPHPETCQVLREQLPSIRQRVRLVPASALVEIAD
jgi:polysaccharide deacetylase 2 family uncharacterized protein YibQ